MENTLRNFLSVFYTDSFDIVRIKIQPPKNVPLNQFNQLFLYTSIKLGELLQQFSGVSQSLRTSNERKNVLMDCETRAVVTAINSLNSIENFVLPPTAIISAGEKVHFAIWVLKERCNFETWLVLQKAVAQMLNAKLLMNSLIPLPTYNLVKCINDNNYSFALIELTALDVERLYTAEEMQKAIVKADKPQSAVLESAEIESAVLDNAKSKSAISKGERTYQQLVKLVCSEMPKSAILESAETNLGLKPRRVAEFLKSAVSRNDLLKVEHGFYAPKMHFSSNELAIAP